MRIENINVDKYVGVLALQLITRDIVVTYYIVVRNGIQTPGAVQGRVYLHCEFYISCSLRLL